MAISLNEYISQTNDYLKIWQKNADEVERDIDNTLQESIVTNIIPDKNNPNFVCRYNFSNKISKAVKDLLKIKYGQAGWTIKENMDFKDSLTYGYFDFYMADIK